MCEFFGNLLSGAIGYTVMAIEKYIYRRDLSSA